MGFRICLVAATVPVERLIAALDCRSLHTTDIPPEGDDWAAHFPVTGWSVAWFEDPVIADVAEQFFMDDLSANAEALVLRVDETAMHSSCVLWRDGHRVWRISHRGDSGDLYDLARLGPAPRDYADLQDVAYAAQDAERGKADHVFDVPVRLFSDRTGLRYDTEISPSQAAMFHAIATIA